jgi:hypothetical protein
MLSTARPVLLAHAPHTKSRTTRVHKTGRPVASSTYVLCTPPTSAPLSSRHDRQPRLVSPDDAIPRFRQALRDVDAKMASLARERTRLVAALEHARRVRAPIRRLPRELLEHVFRAGVADGSDPLLLSSLVLVCRAWHDVAVDTPGLWAQIALGPHHSLDAAERRLARSKDAPLDVSIDLRGQVGQEASDVDAAAAFALLGPTVARWRSFRWESLLHVRPELSLMQWHGAD